MSYRHNDIHTKKFRKKLRSRQTTSEKLLWSRLRRRQRGVRFRRQFGIGPYIVDFYCHECWLVIELYGITHADKETRVKDKVKERYLKERGYRVVRYRDDMVVESVDAVIYDIKKHLVCSPPFRGS